MKSNRAFTPLILTFSLLTLVGSLVMLAAWLGTPSVVRADSYAIYYVAPSCAGVPVPCYTVVQDAVDAVDDPADEVWVAAGTYDDVNAYDGLAQVVYISKTLLLRGGYSADFSTWDPTTNVVTLDANDVGRVLYITGDISPTVEGFRITGGEAAGLGGDPFGNAGGGIYVIDASPIISGNIITGNIASTGFLEDGMGGGLYAAESAPVLQGNQVLNNVAGSTGGFAEMGMGGGLYFVDSQPALTANEIRGNEAVGSFAGNGGGIEMDACNRFTLTNNIVADNEAEAGSGFYFGHMSGIPSAGRMLHTTIANNTGGAGVRVTGGSVISMTNTILAGHDTGINVSFGSTATLTATLWHNTTDSDDVGALFTGTINLEGDPDFLNAASGDYHITASSLAKDKGFDAGVNTDIDGEPRNDGSPDLGADEVGAHGIQVVKTASTIDLYVGDTVTYTIAVSNAGTSGVTNVIFTDRLPALQQPGLASDQCAIVNAGYGGQITCALGDLDVGDGAWVTITAQVTTTIPVTLPQTMRNTAQAVSDQAQGTDHVDTILYPLDCYVRVNGAPPTYTRVQAAVDVAQAGDEIWIAGTCKGAYPRAGIFQQVYVPKTLTLRGGYSTDFAAWDPDTYSTTLDADGKGRVIYVEGAVDVMLEALHLTGGDATGLGGTVFTWEDVGGGVYAITATVTLSQTEITGNVASTSRDGYGGGVYGLDATLNLIEVVLSGNTASGDSLSTGYGGGLSAEFSIVRLERSLLENNTASTGSVGLGMGGGAYFFESELTGVNTMWFSNTVASFQDWGQGGGLYVAGSLPFTLENCVLAGNRAFDATGDGGSALWVGGSPGVLLQPTIARNQGSEGVSVDIATTLDITNAIIVSHSLGIWAGAGSTVTVNGVLWHKNITNTATDAGTILVSNEYTGTPAFAADGYHITSSSEAKDRGVASLVPSDIDGDSRPQGGVYDLGADEYPWTCTAVTGVSINGPANGIVGSGYDFAATVSPANADSPVTYNWSPPPDSGQGTANAKYTWTATGDKSVAVAVSNCGGGGTANYNHTITIGPASFDIYLPLVMRSSAP